MLSRNVASLPPLGASVAKWLAHLPFISEAAGSSLSKNFLNAMRPEPSHHVKRVKVNALPKVVGFLRVLRFPPTGKVDRVG
jgi:citrate synthase